MDLTQGIAASLVKEGELLAGRVGDEEVLLTRHNGEVHAVGATCTHYGGPLKEGLLVDGQIRCPWHHACFSVATGEAIKPPALNPLPRWQVETEGDRIFVRRQLPPADPPEARSTPLVKTVVIVGAGAAGSAAAEALRGYGFEGAITLVDPDADAPYDRPNLSKDYLAGNAPEEWLPLRTPDFYEQQHITRVVDKAVAIDAARRSIALASGAELSYDALLLATGAVPIRPNLPGADLSHVHVLRSLADCRALIGALQEGTKAVIAGASFIGMEAAASLRKRNLDVTVAAPELIPFQKVLGPTIGAALLKLHEQQGVKFHLGRKLSAIGSEDVLLDDGSVLPADVVLLGIGVKPDLALAESAALEIDGGVLVNERLESSVPGIYAAGDIARYPDARNGEMVRIEHWVVAQRQGRSAARSILGIEESYTDVPFFWTQQFDTTVNYVGHATDYTHIQVDGAPEKGDCGAAFMSRETLLAYASIGRDEESLRVEREMEVQARRTIIPDPSSSHSDIR